jgi:RNA polymerase sigma-70 factor (ECF subfamily)
MLSAGGEPAGTFRHQSGTDAHGGRTIAASLDPTIVERARSGDLGAFESIVRSRMDTVYRLTLAIVGNEADAGDATQDAFVAAWRQIRSLRDTDRLDAWLARIAVNAARMVARGRRRRTVREIPGLDPLDADPPSIASDPAAGAADDARALGAALDRLSPDQRSILALHHLDGRGIPEISGILDIPEGTVKSRLFTARRALVAALSESDR